MSKTFVDFLSESKKTYQFKVGVAGVVPEGFAERLETVLKKYGVDKLTGGKKTPIQERPLDFPQLQNTEVTYWEADLSYPTTVQVLQEYLGACCSIPQSHIIVRNLNEPQEIYQAPKDNEPYETKLSTEDMGGESAQESVASNRVMDLLKELETVRKERGNDPVEGTPVGESSDIDNLENTKSPVGS
jgi:hypothetical protein